MVRHAAPTVDSGSIPTPPLHFEVRRITKAEARPMIENNHYSHHSPSSAGSKFFGWFVNSELYAVAQYGYSPNRHSATFFAKLTGRPVTSKNLIELIRLVRAEPRIDDAPLTRFLSVIHKILKKEGFCYVVSHSDPMHNPHGGIYAAANFKHLGWTQAHANFKDVNGNIIHDRVLSRFQERSKQAGRPITRKEAMAQFGYVYVRMEPKKRWFLSLIGDIK